MSPCHYRKMAKSCKLSKLCQIKLLIIAGILFPICKVEAQTRKIILSPVSDSLVLDTVPVAVVTLKVTYRTRLLNPGLDYVLDKSFRTIYIIAPHSFDTLEIEYQTLPEWLEREMKNRDMTFHYKSTTLIDAQKKDVYHDGGDVVTDGILLRGISFGNAQDLVLNSSLNLRMYGNVSKDIVIEGAVTDQEFPFQPEGTTSTLQDFDRIYVALHMPKISVLLGDYAFQSPAGSRFMKYSKKNRGLQLTGKDSIGKSLLQWESTAALARGRFSRNEINGIEGLQGPYRLAGARGEQFVIVVSGTEVVYLDGERLERGLQADYVIDYNLGEITFTPKHIINAFSRIVVEFQYSDRFYTRSVTAGNATLIRKKSSFYLGVYSEQDARNQPIQQDLEAFDSTTGLTAREILRTAGDNPANAVFPGARRLTQFSANEPNYILRDSSGVLFYQHIAVPDTHSHFFRVNFTYLGPGSGTYVLIGATANGKVFRYVGNISGIPAGDYEPITQIQPPSRLSMAETGWELRPRKGTTINSNLSFSSNDKNTFSGIGDNDNSGVAGYVRVTDKRNLGGKDTVHKWYIFNSFQVEKTSAHFTSIERYRDVEFGREWNRSLYNPENGLNPSSSGFATAGTEIGKGNRFSAFVKGGINRSESLSAQNTKAGVRYRYHGWFAEPFAEISNAKVGGQINLFRSKSIRTGFEKSAKRIVATARQETSGYSNSLVELLDQSYGLRELNLSAQNSKTHYAWNISALRRINSNVSAFLLKDAADVRSLSGEYLIRSKKLGFFKLAGSYRDMELIDSSFVKLYSNEKHYSGRLEYNFSRILKILSGNIYYQSISGREQQRQYSYFEVPAGQGYFTWVDFNNNGIKEVNEFQETPFKDQARYVRLLVPTGQYIKAQGTEFNGNIFIQPFAEKVGGEKAKIQNRVTWNYNGRSAQLRGYQRLFPFVSNGSDSGILAFQAFLRNMAEFENKKRSLLLQYVTQSRGSKMFFTNGFDRRAALSNQLLMRLIPGESWQIRLGMEHKTSNYMSEFVPVNSFDYKMKAAEPEVTYQPGSRFRIGLFGKMANFKTGTLLIASLYEGGIQWNKTLGKGSMFEIKTSVLQANYFQPKGTALSYDILQGFSPGQNLRSVIDLRFNAAKNVQIVMSYEGRKTADVKFIHIGRAEARYLF